MIKTKLQNISNGPLKSIDSCLEILNETLALCRQKGATDAVVDFQQEHGFSVDVRMGELESIGFHQKQGLDIVVYRGQRKGAASTTDLRPQSIDWAVQAACDMASVSAEDMHYGLADANTWHTLIKTDLDLHHPWQINPDIAIEKALELESIARAQDTRIVNSDGASVSSYQFVRAGMNSRGFQETIYSSRHGMNCSLVAKQGEDMQSDYAWTSARRYEQLDAVDAVGKRAAERVCQRLGGRTIPTQEAPIIFSNRLSGGLIGSFISAIMGSQLYRKNSFLNDALGQQIFPSFMHIQEYPHLLGGQSSANYDGDGLPTRDNVFIENGILKQYVLGLYSARRLNMQSTGNADGVHNLSVQSTVKDVHEMIGGIEKGFLVTDLMGQGVQILTGNYSRGAAGFWIENGKIQYPVEGVTIAGNLRDMFKGILAVGGDANKNYSTKCGSILIDKMMIAGK